MREAIKSGVSVFLGSVLLALFSGSTTGLSQITSTTLLCNDKNPCTVDTYDSLKKLCNYQAGNRGVICRAATGSCDVAESCTGLSASCPIDSKKAVGAACSDGNACTTNETCQTGGICGNGTPLSLDDHNSCTTDSCDPNTGIVSHAAISGCLRPPKDFLVSQWSAEGGAQDRTGSNPGVLMNQPRFGKSFSGQAFQFDGVNDYVEARDSTSLSITDSSGLTLMAWIRPNVGLKNGTILHKDLHYSITMKEGKLSYADSCTWSYATVGLHGLIPADGTIWTHVAATESADGTNITLYINGKKMGAYQRTACRLTDNANSLQIGAYAGRSGFFGGMIDEASIYKKALTQREIQALFLIFGSRLPGQNLSSLWTTGNPEAPSPTRSTDAGCCLACGNKILEDASLECMANATPRTCDGFSYQIDGTNGLSCNQICDPDNGDPYSGACYHCADYCSAVSCEVPSGDMATCTGDYQGCTDSPLCPSSTSGGEGSCYADNTYACPAVASQFPAAASVNQSTCTPGEYDFLDLASPTRIDQECTVRVGTLTACDINCDTGCANACNCTCEDETTTECDGNCTLPIYTNCVNPCYANCPFSDGLCRQNCEKSCGNQPYTTDDDLGNCLGRYTDCGETSTQTTCDSTCSAKGACQSDCGTCETLCGTAQKQSCITWLNQVKACRSQYCNDTLYTSLIQEARTALSAVGDAGHTLAYQALQTLVPMPDGSTTHTTTAQTAYNAAGTARTQVLNQIAAAENQARNCSESGVRSAVDQAKSYVNQMTLNDQTVINEVKIVANAWVASALGHTNQADASVSGIREIKGKLDQLLLQLGSSPTRETSTLLSQDSTVLDPFPDLLSSPNHTVKKGLVAFAIAKVEEALNLAIRNAADARGKYSSALTWAAKPNASAAKAAAETAKNYAAAASLKKREADTKYDEAQNDVRDNFFRVIQKDYPHWECGTFRQETADGESPVSSLSPILPLETKPPMHLRIWSRFSDYLKLIIPQAIAEELKLIGTGSFTEQWETLDSITKRGTIYISQAIYNPSLSPKGFPWTPAGTPGNDPENYVWSKLGERPCRIKIDMQGNLFCIDAVPRNYSLLEQVKPVLVALNTASKRRVQKLIDSGWYQAGRQSVVEFALDSASVLYANLDLLYSGKSTIPLIEVHGPLIGSDSGFYQIHLKKIFYRQAWPFDAAYFHPAYRDIALLHEIKNIIDHEMEHALRHHAFFQDVRTPDPSLKMEIVLEFSGYLMNALNYLTAIEMPYQPSDSGTTVTEAVFTQMQSFVTQKSLVESLALAMESDPHERIQDGLWDEFDARQADGLYLRGEFPKFLRDFASEIINEGYLKKLPAGFLLSKTNP